MEIPPRIPSLTDPPQTAPVNPSPPVPPELLAEMANKSTPELLAILEAPQDWTEEALNAAQLELQKREVNPTQAENPETPPLLERPKVRPGIMCPQHPTVQAVQRCRVCGACMCETCDFAFPEDLHFCPACISKSEGGLSPKRKKRLIAAYLMAAWSTFGMVCVVSGALSGFADSKEAESFLGVLFLIFVLGPAITGLALGVSTRRKQAANPATVWIAIIWNAILVASFVLLMIIGLTMR